MASVLRKMASALAGGEHKLALVVRQDLKMDKGKTAAQCSHATLACYKAAMKRNPSAVRAWEATGQAKVVLKCKDELEMAQLERKAREHGLVAQSIHDAYVLFLLLVPPSNPAASFLQGAHTSRRRLTNRARRGPCASRPNQHGHGQVGLAVAA